MAGLKDSRLLIFEDDEESVFQYVRTWENIFKHQRNKNKYQNSRAMVIDRSRSLCK